MVLPIGYGFKYHRSF